MLSCCDRSLTDDSAALTLVGHERTSLFDPPRSALVSCMQCRVGALLLALQWAAPSRAAAPETLAWDPAIRRGTLENGLSYLVERHPNPPGKLEARLIVSGGSSLERDDERGLAHFCEHMAFNGSEHFPPGELDAHFARLGIPLGKDVTAFTSEDRVVYWFAYPSRTAEDLDGVADLLADFAGGATLSDRDIEAERGVVLAELRKGLGDDERYWRSWDEEALTGTPFAQRNPIGLAEVIATAPPAAIRDACRRWYRPDLMTVVIVGDVEVDAIVTLLEKRLAVRERSADPATTNAWSLPADRRFASAPGASAESTVRLAVMTTDPPTDDGATLEQARQALARALGRRILDHRLQALLTAAESPLLRGSIKQEDAAARLRGLTTTMLWGTTRPGREIDAAVALGSLLAAAGQRGFTAAELSWARNELTQSLDGAPSRAAARTSADEVEDVVEAWLHRRPKPAPATEVETLRWLALAMQPEDLGAAWKDVLDRSRLVVMTSCPEGAPCPDAAALEAAWARVTASDLVPASKAAQPPEAPELIPNPPPPGSIVERRTHPASRVEEMLLSNGMRLLFRDAESAPGRMRLAGTASGGTYGMDERGRGAAELLGPVLALSGTADHSPAFNQEWMKLQLASGPLRRQMYSGCPSRHLDGLMQVIHAAFARPAFRPEALDRAREVLRARREADASDAGVATRAFVEIATGGDRRLAPAPPSLDGVTLDDLRAAHAALLSDPSEWTLTFVGSVDLEAAAKLAETWLASIPRPPPVTRPSPMLRAVAGRRVRELAAGTEERSLVLVGMRWDLTDGIDGGQDLNDVATILRHRLGAILRERLAATYTVAISSRQVPPDGGITYITAQFDCEPARRHELAAIAEREMRATCWRPLDELTVQAMRQAYAVQIPAALASDDFWVDQLPRCVQRGIDPDQVVSCMARADQVHARTIPRIAAAALVPRDTIVVTTVPVEK